MFLCLLPQGEGAGGGGTLIFSYIRRLGSSYLGFKVLNFNIFWAFRKINIFLGMKILWIFFGVITKLDYKKGSFICILGSFLKVIIPTFFHMHLS